MAFDLIHGVGEFGPAELDRVGDGRGIEARAGGLARGHLQSTGRGLTGDHDAVAGMGGDLGVASPRTAAV